MLTFDTDHDELRVEPHEIDALRSARLVGGAPNRADLFIRGKWHRVTTPLLDVITQVATVARLGSAA